MPTKPIDNAGEWVNNALFWLEGLTDMEECGLSPHVAHIYLGMAILCLENAKNMLE